MRCTLQLHRIAPLDRVLHTQRASGGMIAAAPAGANPDAGALLASAGLGAEQRSDVGDRRAKRARARLGAGLNKVGLQCGKALHKWCWWDR